MVTSDDRCSEENRPRSGLNRREFLPFLGAATLVTVAPRALAAAPSRGSHSGDDDRAEDRFVYVGTYTAPGIAPGGHVPSTAVGIYVFRMNGDDGGLTPIEVVTTDNPSFLALDPSLTHLYSTNENGADGHNVPLGRVSAYAIDKRSGTLSLLNTALTNGTFPAHLSVHPSGKYLLGSNYGTGNFPIYRILADGSIGARTDDFHDAGNGTGPNPDRQEGPHAHQIPGRRQGHGVEP